MLDTHVSEHQLANPLSREFTEIYVTGVEQMYPLAEVELKIAVSFILYFDHHPSLQVTQAIHHNIQPPKRNRPMQLRTNNSLKSQMITDTKTNPYIDITTSQSTTLTVILRMLDVVG